MYEDEDDFCCCSKESSDRCFVISVSFLIGFCFCSYWYIIVIPWGWIYEPSWVGFINLVGLHVSFSLLCVSYYKTMTTCPGFVEKGWIPPGATSEELQTIIDETEQNAKKVTLDLSHFYQPRWCKFCKNWKPPRSHHCKDINRCVLKMDHYCPWVYNVVGYRNHKYFILFLYYASLCLSYFLVCCVIRAVQILVASKIEDLLLFGVIDGIILLFQLVLTLPVTIGIISLFFYQAWCLTSNFTSVESFTYEQYKRVAKKTGEEFKWFYDFGFLHNTKQVLGPTIQEWFLPIIPEHIKHGDGTTWKTRQFQLKSVYDTENTFDPSRLHKRQSKPATEENATLFNS